MTVVTGEGAQQAPPTGDPVLTSKLAFPPVPSSMVPRARLQAQLDEAAHTPLTLVSAAAGSGKTTLVSAWAQRSGDATATTRRVGWLTLDRADNDPSLFWSYVTAAIGAHERSMPPLLQTLARGADADRSFLVRLAAWLASMPQPLTLVLDQYESIDDPDLAAGLDFVLRHASGQLRLLVVTRTDPPLPLHRYRLAGHLAQVRARDLAFTPVETAELLDHDGLTLSPGGLASLVARTEGWVAGLRLAVLAMQARSDHEQFVAEFAAGDTAIADYLLAEVLAVQPAETRDFLLRTSILERVHPDLADELTGRHDALRRLDELAHANAFVYPLESSPGWQRYHRLLADVLRFQLAYELPDEVPELHRRAARWLARAGELDSAVSHASTAGDWRLAATLVTDALAYPTLLVGSASAPGARLAHTLSAMPEGLTDPEPVLVSAALAVAGNVEGSSRQLRRAEAAVAGLPDDAVYTHLALAMLQAHVARANAHAGAVLAATRSARALLPHLGPGKRSAHPELAGQLLAHEAAAHAWAGQLDEAEHALESGLALTGDEGAEYVRLDLLGQLCLLDVVRGRLHRAAELSEEAHELTGRAGLSGGRGMAAAALGMAWAATERNDLTTARRCLEGAEGTPQDGRDPLLAAGLALVRARLLRAKGDLSQALGVLAHARTVGNGSGGVGAPPWMDLTLATTQAAMLIASSEPAAGLAVLDTLDVAEGSSPECAVAYARGRIAVGDRETAAEELISLLSGPPDHPSACTLVEALVVHAGLAGDRGDLRGAVSSLDRALRLAKPEELRRPFVEAGPTVRQILRADAGLMAAHEWLGPPLLPRQLALVPGQVSPPGHPGPRSEGALPLVVEPLSDRERAVLGHLAQMMSTDEIAAEMHLSVNTVKTHLKSIYRKLSAKRRSEAVRTARSLGLL